MKQKIPLSDLLQVFYFILSFNIVVIYKEQLSEIRRMTMSNLLCQTIKGMNAIQIDAFRIENHLE
jgi:hypothetical protein